ncbi:putative quinol monooxygenase [Chitinophaga sp. sic0106]|uniref:putative quinol monooxygenase n=1 Tax=Chitinophaga sp. sic0106 TaxID=2854785 RepID=UPI001C471F8C|nr:putative quinol monooxygenase [Chitinophaga sp. sic0106]MBV7530135.1 antibiotic biosynthesis monooxygenase [Chitinophaga sp. sic0106]
MNIYLTAIIKSKPEFTADIKAILLNMVEESRKESACIQYDLHQDNDDASTFFFHEIWSSAEGLGQHNQQPYIVAFGAAAKTMLAETPVILKGHKLA